MHLLPDTLSLSALSQVNTHLNLGSCLVMIPTSSSEGLKSMDRTVVRHEIAVCCKTRWMVVKKSMEGKRRGNFTEHLSVFETDVFELLVIVNAVSGARVCTWL